MEYEEYYIKRDLEECRRWLSINAKIRKNIKETQSLISELPPDAEAIYALETKTQLEAILRTNTIIDYRYGTEELRLEAIINSHNKKEDL